MEKLNELAKVYFLIITLILLFNVQTTGQKTRRITFSNNDYEIKELVNPKGESIIKITSKNFICISRPGEPEIPVKLLKLIIAHNEDVERIDYKVLSKTERKLTAKICSMAENEIIEKSIRSTILQNKIYNSDEAWPKDIVKVVSSDYFDENNHIITLSVSPIQYYPKLNKIDVINEIEYTIKTKGSNKKIKIPFREPEYQKIYDDALTFIVDNKEDIPLYSVKSIPKVNMASLKKTATLTYGYPYVIITTSTLAPSFEKFIKWKRRKGYDVGLFTVDQIYQECTKGDTLSRINDYPAKIRQFLHKTYHAGTCFCLIGGTHELVPARYGTRDFDMWKFKVDDDFKVPTDLYYSELNGNWNKDDGDDSLDVYPTYRDTTLFNWQNWNSNNPFDSVRYGEPRSIYDDSYHIIQSGDSIDYSPELFVGRLLCTSSDEILRWTDKVIRYEQNPGRGNSSYLSRSLMTEADQMQDYPFGSIVGVAEYMASQLPPAFSNTIIKEMTSGSAYSTSPSGSSIISNINTNKYGLWTWINHGTAVNIRVNSTGLDTTTDGREITGMDSWHFDNAEETGNGLNSLTNGDYPMIVYAQSCLVAPLDNYDGNPDYDMGKNMAQCFTTEFNVGGPAFLGASRSIPMNNYDLNKTFMDGLNNGIYNLGELEALAKTGSNHEASIIHNLIGCPETSLWTATPSYFTNVTITDNGSSITINCNIAGSTIAVCNVNSGVDYVEKQINCSSATFYSSVRPLYVTITKQNYIPYTAITGGTFGQTLTVDVDETLYIQAGANLCFPSGTGIIVNGKLNAIGSSSNNIIFTRSGSSGTWNGIRFNSGSSGTVQYCTITYATDGVYCYNSSPQIKYNTIRYCGDGVELNNYSSPNLAGNTILENTGSGVVCNSYSSPYFTDGYGDANVIRNNSYYGVYAYYNSNPNLNKGTYGAGNSVKNNTSYELNAIYNCTVVARNVWWGYSDPPTSEFNLYISSLDRSNPLSSDPYPSRNVIADNEYTQPQRSGLMKGVDVNANDNLNTALDKQKSKKYDEAIPLFLDVFKNNKEYLLGRFALSKIEECFTQAGKKDYLDYSKKEIKPLVKENDEINVEVLELEAHQMINNGLYKNAINNLITILKNYNYNKEIDKNTLFILGSIYSLYFGDNNSSDKYFGELRKKYPKDELLNQIEIIKSFGVIANNYNIDGESVLPNGNTIEENSITEELFSNFPNPFNPTTQINFTLKKSGKVSLKIYDVLGREVKKLVDGLLDAGKHTATFDGSNLASGIYFYRLSTPTSTITKKMMLVK